jgi:hypothetical protein
MIDTIGLVVAALNIVVAYFAVKMTSTVIMATVYYTIGMIVIQVVMKKAVGYDLSGNISFAPGLLLTGGVLYVFYEKHGVTGVLTSIAVSLAGWFGLSAIMARL